MASSSQKRCLTVGIVALALSPTPAGAVSGGTSEPIAQAPYVAWLAIGASGGICTGTLISPTRILTAAHCIQNADATESRVVMGIDGNLAWAVEQQAAEVPIKGFSVDPRFRVSFPFLHASGNEGIGIDDLAIVVLARPVTKIKPVGLPTTREAEIAAPGTAVSLIGYGTTQPIGTPPPGFVPPTGPTGLQRGPMTVISRTACARAYPRVIAPSMVCTEDLARHKPLLVQPCGGDSGGPIVQQTSSGPVEIGVTSWGSEVMGADCGERQLPAVAMRTSSFASFTRAARLPLEPFVLGASAQHPASAQITGQPQVGHTLTCHVPRFGGDRATITYQWLSVARTTTPLRGLTHSTVSVTSALLRRMKSTTTLGCAATARSAGGALTLMASAELRG